MMKCLLATCGRNASYTSKNIQNQLIDVCGSIIQSTVLNRVKAAKIYSIIGDEATDVSNKEQLAIYIRYVQQSTVKIEERFLTFFSECDTGVTGEALADRILGHLETWQLPASGLCGQAFDGVGAMAGKNKGAATRITERYPKALCTHCTAHLCVVKCCNLPEIRNTMDVADSICRYFAYSPKRQL